MQVLKDQYEEGYSINILQFLQSFVSKQFEHNQNEYLWRKIFFLLLLLNNLSLLLLYEEINNLSGSFLQTYFWTTEHFIFKSFFSQSESIPVGLP